MPKLNVGDKVRRKTEYLGHNMWKKESKVLTVLRTPSDTGLIDIGCGKGNFWDSKYFELVSEKENDVSNEVEKQVPGVPDGYRLVRIGVPKRGELYVVDRGYVREALGDWGRITCEIAIVELIKPIEPPKPKTEEVVLNKYLVGVGLMRTMLVATAEYMDTYYYDYKLIGHSETVEVEVGV